MLPNMFNSPHGWSGWRGYATYYAYLLTGEERWLSVKEVRFKMNRDIMLD